MYKTGSGGCKRGGAKSEPVRRPSNHVCRFKSCVQRYLQQVHVDVLSATATAAFDTGQCHYSFTRLSLVPQAY